MAKAVEDLDHALVAFESSAQPDELRRTLRTILGEVNRLREHRRATLTSAVYFARWDKSSEGQVTEALIMVRGFSEHDLTRPVSPESRGLYPGEIYPSGYLYPGTNLVWLPQTELPFVMLPIREAQDRRPEYDRHLAGQPVAATFAIARQFLVEDTWLGPL